MTNVMKSFRLANELKEKAEDLREQYIDVHDEGTEVTLEEVQAAEKEAMEACLKCVDMFPEFVAGLINTINFYAERENWDPRLGHSYVVGESRVQDDHGDYARTTLSKVGSAF